MILVEYHKMNIGYLEELYSVNLCNIRKCSDQNARRREIQCFPALCRDGFGATPLRLSHRVQALGLGVVHKWPHSMPGPQLIQLGKHYKPLGHGFPIFRRGMIRSQRNLRIFLAVLWKKLEDNEDIFHHLWSFRENFAPRGPGPRFGWVGWVLPGTDGLILRASGFSGKHHQLPFSAFLIVVIHRL